MFRGYRSIIITVAGLILVGAGHPNKKTADSEQSNADSSKTDTVPTADVRLPTSAHQDVGCKEGKEDRKSDLCAQWKAADAANAAAKWAWWQMIAGFFGLLVGAGTLFAAMRAAHWAKQAASHTQTGANASLDTVKAANAANRISKGAVRAEKLREYRLSRPCIGVEQVEIADTDQGSVTYKINIKNFGQTPAHDVHYSAKIARRKDISPEDLDWSFAHPQFLAPTQTLGLPVVAERFQLQTSNDVYLVIEIRYTDTLGGVWSLQQRYVTANRKVWHTDDHGNKETLVRSPKMI